MDDTIRRLRESGTSIREIKRLVGCGQARIMRALETPMGTSCARPRGPQPKLTPEALKLIEETTLADGRTTNLSLVNRVKEEFGISVSPALICQARHQLHFTYRPPMRVQTLKAFFS